MPATQLPLSQIHLEVDDTANQLDANEIAVTNLSFSEGAQQEDQT